MVEGGSTTAGRDLITAHRPIGLTTGPITVATTVVPTRVLGHKGRNLRESAGTAERQGTLRGTAPFHLGQPVTQVR